MLSHRSAHKSTETAGWNVSSIDLTQVGHGSIPVKDFLYGPKEVAMLVICPVYGSAIN